MMRKIIFRPLTIYTIVALVAMNFIFIEVGSCGIQGSIIDTAQKITKTLSVTLDDLMM